MKIEGVNNVIYEPEPILMKNSPPVMMHGSLRFFLFLFFSIIQWRKMRKSSISAIVNNNVSN